MEEWNLWCVFVLELGLSKQPGDQAKPTKPIGPDPSRPNPTPLAVGDGSYSLKPDFGESSGGFQSLKPEPPDSTDKC